MAELNTNRNFNKDKKIDMTKIMAGMGKLPPQAIDFEEVVLGAIMLETEAFYKVSGLLSPEKFYSPVHGIIFEAILKLSTEQLPIDILTVSQKLKQLGKLDDVGGQSYLAHLTNKVASTAHLEHHSLIISQKFIQRELIRVGAKIQENAFEDTDDVADILDMAEQELFKVSEGNIKKDVASIGDVVAEAIKQIEEAAKKPDGLSGVPSGFTDLDRMTSGWQPSDLVVIAARPAMGKTAFVLSMARNIAVDHKRPVAIFSLEMSNEQLVKRIISSESEISGEKLKSGKLADWEWTQLETKIRNLENAPMYVDDTPALSVMELRSKLRKLKLQHGIELVIIDYLQLMTAGSNVGSREQEVSMISRSLKAIAKEINVPIIALSQLNRSVEMRAGDKKPQLSDLRESGAIEQDADMVMFIHRPEYYGITQDEDGNSLLGLGELIIAKHRSGAIGEVFLRFVKEFTRFQDRDASFSMIDTGGNTFQSKMNSGDSDSGIPELSANKNFNETSGLSANTDFEESGNAPF